MGSNYQMRYDVDLVLVVDATMSMYGLLDQVKASALRFHDDIQKAMSAKGKHVDELRVKLITFRDYEADGRKNALQETDFFNLPAESDSFKRAADFIKADGGGDDPEDGLEALACAMRSNWSRSSLKKRNVIVVWSDEGCHGLGEGKKMDMPDYPEEMPRSFDELTRMWGDKMAPGIMDEYAKRLVIYGPDTSENNPNGEENGHFTNYWKEIAMNWNKVVYFPSEAGKGLRDVEYNEICAIIANTI